MNVGAPGLTCRLVSSLLFFGVVIGSEDIDTGHHIGLLQMVRRLELRAIDLKRLLEQPGGKVRPTCANTPEGL